MGDRDSRNPYEQSRGGRGGRHVSSGGRYSNDRGASQSGGGYSYAGSGRRGTEQQNGSGYKRKRFEQEPLSEELQLLQRLLLLGDQRQQATSAPLEAQIRDTARLLRRNTVLKTEQLQDDLVECCIQLGTKVEVYAALIALLNMDDAEFVEGILNVAAAKYVQSWEALDKSRTALLLRLFAALSVLNVVSSITVMGALCSTVEAAVAVAQGAAGEADPSGRTWQPYTDAIVESALLAIPWGGSDLWEGGGDSKQQLQDKVQLYLNIRPRSRQSGLCPFFAALDEQDIAADSDEGAASFLPELWTAIMECQAEHRWAELSIPSVHEAVEQDIVDATTHALPPLPVPNAVPGLDTTKPINEQAAWLLDALPARGIIRLLSSQRTLGERPLLARIVGEQYILDTLQYWEGDRRQCTVRLAKELPLEYAYEDLLAEVLFSQMLRTPRSPMNPLGYGSIIIDFIQQFLPSFARSLSACVRECFVRCSNMYPELLVRLAQWLAFHLSNLNYTWPWMKWSHVLDAPAHDSQRFFCAMVLGYLIRLSYYDLGQQVLPEEFHVLLPPQPAVRPLELHSSAQQGEEEDMEDDEDTPEPDAETQLAMQLLEKIREKVPASGVEAWLQEGEHIDAAGGPEGVLRSFLTALLVGGSKSFTHMVVLLERYYVLLNQLVQQAGVEGQLALVETAAAVWQSSSQRTVMAVDRLLALRLVTPHSVVQWALQRSVGIRSTADYVAMQTTYEVLHCAIGKSVARTQDARDDVVIADAALASAEAAAVSAAQRLEVEKQHPNTAAVGPDAPGAEANGKASSKVDDAEASLNADSEGAPNGQEAIPDAAEQVAVDAAPLPAPAGRSNNSQLQSTKNATDRRVLAAREAVAAKEAELQERIQQQQELMIAVARGFASLLVKSPEQFLLDLPEFQDDDAEAGVDDDMDAVDAEDTANAERDDQGDTQAVINGTGSENPTKLDIRAAAAAAWRKQTLARCRGVLRQYHVQFADVVGGVQEAFSDAPKEIQSAILLMLTL